MNRRSCFGCAVWWLFFLAAMVGLVYAVFFM